MCVKIWLDFSVGEAEAEEKDRGHAEAIKIIQADKEHVEKLGRFLFKSWSTSCSTESRFSIVCARIQWVNSHSGSLFCSTVAFWSNETSRLPFDYPFTISGFIIKQERDCTCDLAIVVS